MSQQATARHEGNGDGNEEPNPPTAGAEVNANSVYPRIPLPSLVEGATEAYFMSLEFWFEASGVTSDARRYCTVLAQVPPTKLQELSTTIAAAPERNKYEYIKSSLIKHFADSQSRRLQRVLSEMPLGDKRPSQLYHDMARVAGTALGETALRDLWAARLPQFTQTAVVAARGTLVEILETADRVHDSISLRQNQVAHIQPAAVAPAGPSELTQLINKIDETFRRFRDEMSQDRNGRHPARDNSRNRNRSRNRSGQRGERASGNDPNGWCWYHTEFGRQAQKCREPCTYAPPASTNATPPAQNQNNNH